MLLKDNWWVRCERSESVVYSEQMQSIKEEELGEEARKKMWFYTYQAMRQEDVLAAIAYMNQKILVEIRIVE